jgi:hypothetical protein
MKAARAFLAAAVLSAPLALAAQEPPPSWTFDATAYGYFPPEDRDYGQPTVTADRGALHLEGRYNYESFRTGSLWLGWNLGAGEKLRLDVTLMAGGVFGDLRGVAPGIELTLTYGRFALYSEGEYVFDLEDSSSDFFYNWSQLSYAPTDWLQLGLVAQRTRAYKTSLDVQRGFFVGFSWKSLSLTAYVFNPGWETPTFVSSLGVKF